MAGIVSHTIDDGAGRYGSRTRVNRVVYEWETADLDGGIMAMAQIPMNGEIHTIWLDVSGSKLSSNANGDTIHGSFGITCGDYTTVSGHDNFYCSVISALDFTNKGNVVYRFQTNEGAAMGTMEHALSVQPGLSAHGSSPAAPKVLNTAGTPTAIAKNQPWTGRVCGKVKITLSIHPSAGVQWAADTDKIRLTILYS